MMQQWNPSFLQLNPLFNDLKSLLADYNWSSWPQCEQLNQLLTNEVVNELGKQLVLVEQTDQLLSDGLYYEQRIYLEAQVPTRPRNWHDFFNAIIYMLFPRTKQQINRLHYLDIGSDGLEGRTKRRDAPPLFDECGVIIAYCDEQLKQQLTDQQWQQAFVENRTAWGQSIDGFIIGHANYEKALDPYIGFTAKALYVKVDIDFFKLEKLAQYRYLDGYLADNLTRLIVDNSQLYPLPILGVPHWWAANNDAEFYNNKNYFRPKRMKARNDC